MDCTDEYIRKSYSTEAIIQEEAELNDKKIFNLSKNNIFDKLIINFPVKKELLSYLYGLKNKKLYNTPDARYGNGSCSNDFQLFEHKSKIISNFESGIKEICKKEIGLKKITLKI